MHKWEDMELLSSETEIKFDEVYTEHFPSPENRLLSQIQALWKSSWKDCKVGNFERFIQSTTFPTELRNTFFCLEPFLHLKMFFWVDSLSFYIIIWMWLLKMQQCQNFIARISITAATLQLTFAIFFGINSRSTLIGMRIILSRVRPDLNVIPWAQIKTGLI